jgi:hypothetical protein
MRLAVGGIAMETIVETIRYPRVGNTEIECPVLGHANVTGR